MMWKKKHLVSNHTTICFFFFGSITKKRKKALPLPQREQREGLKTSYCSNNYKTKQKILEKSELEDSTDWLRNNENVAPDDVRLNTALCDVCETCNV